MEDWAEIRRMHRSERIPITVIARVLSISKNTVKSALTSYGPPKYDRAPAGPDVDEVEPRIWQLLKAVPTTPATVIAERIGWTRGMTVLTEWVREMRPVYLTPAGTGVADGVSGRGGRAERFWFPGIEIPVGSGSPARPSRCRC